jgi:natural product precursor
MNAKKHVKKLSLNRETVRELQADEMSAVAGGVASLLTTCINSLPLTVCQCTGNYTQVNCGPN